MNLIARGGDPSLTASDGRMVGKSRKIRPINQSFTKGQLLTAQRRRAAQASGGLSAIAELLVLTCTQKFRLVQWKQIACAVEANSKRCYKCNRQLAIRMVNLLRATQSESTSSRKITGSLTTNGTTGPCSHRLGINRPPPT